MTQTRPATRSSGATAPGLARDVPHRLAGLAAPASAVSTVLAALTLGAALMTMLTMIVLGPFGFIPALVMGPLFLASGLFGWLAERWSRTATVAEPEALLEHLPDDLHAALPTWLERIEREADPARLDELLGWFEVALEEHFVQEEDTGGVFEHLREMDPRMIGPVAMLEGEHDRIRALLLETRRRCGERRRYTTSKRLLLTTIRAHQRAEDELFQEAYGIRVEGRPLSA